MSLIIKEKKEDCCFDLSVILGANELYLKSKLKELISEKVIQKEDSNNLLKVYSKIRAEEVESVVSKDKSSAETNRLVEIETEDIKNESSLFNILSNSSNQGNMAITAINEKEASNLSEVVLKQSNEYKKINIIIEYSSDYLDYIKSYWVGFEKSGKKFHGNSAENINEMYQKSLQNQKKIKLRQEKFAKKLELNQKVRADKAKKKKDEKEEEKEKLKEAMEKNPNLKTKKVKKLIKKQGNYDKKEVENDKVDENESGSENEEADADNEDDALEFSENRFNPGNEYEYENENDNNNNNEGLYKRNEDNPKKNLHSDSNPNKNKNKKKIKQNQNFHQQGNATQNSHYQTQQYNYVSGNPDYHNSNIYYHNYQGNQGGYMKNSTVINRSGNYYNNVDNYGNYIGNNFQGHIHNEHGQVQMQNDYNSNGFSSYDSHNNYHQQPYSQNRNFIGGNQGGKKHNKKK